MPQGRYFLSIADVDKLKRLILWFDRNRNKTDTKPARRNIAGQPDKIRIARTIEFAPLKTSVQANLLDQNGYEFLTGSNSDVTINCEIVGGGTLLYALPFLRDGEYIPVRRRTDGTWCCIIPFQKVRAWP